MDAKKQRKVEEMASQQGWRRVWIVGNHSEIEQAHQVRKGLVEAEVYPPQEIPGEDGAAYEFDEARMRAELPDILAELDYIDLLAVWRTARLLAIVPRDPSVFEYSAAKTALTMGALAIEDVLDLGELDALEVELGVTA